TLTDNRLICFFLCLILPLVSVSALSATEPRCLYVSSYHQGYAWSDGVEKGVRSVLEGQCDYRQFDMDTKRNKTPAYKENVGRQVRDLVREWKPDVVITSDDNAAKYVIQAHFKDASLPFVFCGVNWTAKEYGFPYSNVTGIIEVAPLRPMLRQAASLSGKVRGGYYLGADTFTEIKNQNRMAEASEELGIPFDGSLVSSMQEWMDAYKAAQAYDFVILGSFSGIDDWNKETARQFTLANTKRLSVTNHGWMMPFTLLGYTKVPEEHGEWAAKSALAILDGMSPMDIPIVSNRRWDLWLNTALLESSGLNIPRKLLRKAKRVSRE
ncbi:MAG: hypothetical protein ABW120_07090, partial [Sedimenticola sp.]